MKTYNAWVIMPDENLIVLGYDSRDMSWHSIYRSKGDWRYSQTDEYIDFEVYEWCKMPDAPIPHKVEEDDVFYCGTTYWRAVFNSPTLEWFLLSCTHGYEHDMQQVKKMHFVGKYEGNEHLFICD